MENTISTEYLIFALGVLVSVMAQVFIMYKFLGRGVGLRITAVVVGWSMLAGVICFIFGKEGVGPLSMGGAVIFAVPTLTILLNNISRKIIQPTQQMAGAAAAIAKGELEQHIQITTKDELGDMALAFQEMVIYLQEMADAADALASGDLNVHVLPRSELDVLGNAFRRMIGYQQAMAEVAQRMAQGDLQAEITPRSDKDQLGNTFTQMISSLRELVRQVQKSASEVAATSKEIDIAFNQSAMATNQVANEIQRIAGGTSRQTERVMQTNVIIEHVNQAIRGVAQGAQEQAIAISESSEMTTQISATVMQMVANAEAGADGAAQATQTAHSSAAIINDTIHRMQKIERVQEQALDKVQQMGKRSREIGLIVDTIDKIAAQTNLLALNAAIEAARAGEHGKGFAVVASEIRRLAENASTSTEEVASIIEDIQATVTEAVGAIDITNDEINAGVSQANESGQALRTILEAMTAVKQQVDEIVDASQLMNNSVNAMVNTMDSVSAVVEENTSATEEMASSAAQVAEIAGEIANISEENSASIDQVSASIEEVSAQTEEAAASAASLSELAQMLQMQTARFRLSAG